MRKRHTFTESERMRYETERFLDTASRLIRDPDAVLCRHVSRLRGRREPVNPIGVLPGVRTGRAAFPGDSTAKVA